jgi:hypothetical protein
MDKMDEIKTGGEIKTFDILVGLDKKGVAHDSNPIVVTTDEQCRILLNDLKNKISFTKKELKFINNCIKIVSSTDGDDIQFGPMDIVRFSSLANKYINESYEIMACAHHITESVDFEGDLPPDMNLQAALAFASLSDVMLNGNKS